jgi:hypothetical protein
MNLPFLFLNLKAKQMLSVTNKMQKNGPIIDFIVKIEAIKLE